MSARMHYREGFAYQLAEDFTIATGIRPRQAFSTRFLRLDEDGTLSQGRP